MYVFVQGFWNGKLNSECQTRSYLTPSCCSNSMASVCAYRNTLVSFNASEVNSSKRSLNLVTAVM